METTMKCPLCRTEMKPVTCRMTFYNNSISINPVQAMQCQKCGEQTISEREYECIRQKVSSLRKVEKEQNVKEIVAVI